MRERERGGGGKEDKTGKLHRMQYLFAKWKFPFFGGEIAAECIIDKRQRKQEKLHIVSFELMFW